MKIAFDINCTKDTCGSCRYQSVAGCYCHMFGELQLDKNGYVLRHKECLEHQL